MTRKKTALTALQEKEARLRQWHAANPNRARELNDALDACACLNEKRALYATFTRVEKDGMMPEYLRRGHNRQAPQGSVVRPRNLKHGFSIVSRDGPSTTYASHNGLATVLGIKDGDPLRYLMLHEPWENREGQIIVFAEAQAYELEVIS
jgi:hypothetical protein